MGNFYTAVHGACDKIISILGDSWIFATCNTRCKNVQRGLIQETPRVVVINTWCSHDFLRDKLSSFDYILRCIGNMECTL